MLIENFFVLEGTEVKNKDKLLILQQVMTSWFNMLP